MAFKDALRFFYERAKAAGKVQDQDDFARRHGLTRSVMNQFMTGNETPAAKTMWGIIEREGYSLADCIDVPEVLEKRKAHLAIAEDLLQRNNGEAAWLRHYLEFLDWRGRQETTAVFDSKPPPVRKRRGVS